MEKRHLRLIPIVLSASLFTFSCVDNDYDLTDDIDLTIQVGGSEFAIPGGETEPILLSKILDIEEDGVVKTDEYGNYYLWQEGSETTTDISVDDFEINSPDINPINQVLNFNLPSIGGVQENLPPITLDEMTTNFKLDGTELPKEIFPSIRILPPSNLTPSCLQSIPSIGTVTDSPSILLAFSFSSRKSP